MEIGYCETCNGKDGEKINLLGLHICNDCLEYISRLETGHFNYEYYKSIISKAWSKYYLSTN